MNKNARWCPRIVKYLNIICRIVKIMLYGKVWIYWHVFVVSKFVLNVVINTIKIYLVNKLWIPSIFKQGKNSKLIIVLIVQLQLRKKEVVIIWYVINVNMSFVGYVEACIPQLIILYWISLDVLVFYNY